jgi:hypothetical protein
MKIDGLGTMTVEEAKEMMNIAMGMNKDEEEAYQVELEMEGITIRTDVQYVALVLKELQKVNG